MKRFRYSSGEEIQVGDNVRYQGEVGFIDFILSEPTGEPLMDQVLADHPEGGISARIPGGSEFLFEAQVGPDLEFVSRENS